MAAKKRSLSRSVTSKVQGGTLKFDTHEEFFNWYTSDPEASQRRQNYIDASPGWANANYTIPAICSPTAKANTVAYYRCHAGLTPAVTIQDDDGNEVVLTGRKAEAHRYGGDPVTSFFRPMHHNVCIGLNVDMPFGSPRTGAQTADIEL